MGPGMAGGRAPPQKKCMGASFMLSSHFLGHLGTVGTRGAPMGLTQIA